MDYVREDLKRIWHPCSQMKDYEALPPIVVERAKGLYLYDIDGNSYMDIVSSWWCNLLGHCNENINAAVKKQLDQLEHVIFSNFSHKPAIELCSKLHSFLPDGLSKFFFTDNGSSAIEAAMKMSFQYHQQTGSEKKKLFMALTDAYHGETIGALSVSGVDLYSKMYKPLLLDIIRIPSPDCYRCKHGKQRETCDAECFDDSVKVFDEHGEEVSAFLVEPMLQAAAGMKVYSPVFLKKLRAECTKYGIHLIADEIATGYGRTGEMFACNHAGISPDIMCLSKGLTGGYLPMAIAVTTDEIYSAFYADYSEGKAFMHSHTYSGNPLACSAALEVLNVLDNREFWKELEEKSRFFSKLVEETFSSHRYVGDIRSIGLINAIELVKDKSKKESFDSKNRYGYKIYKKALKKGLLLRPLGDVLYFNPPLIITKAEMQKAVDVCLASIDEVFSL